MLTSKTKLLKRLLPIILILTALMLSGCQTCPKEVDAEPVKILDPGVFPEPIVISNFNSDQKTTILKYFADVYTEHLKLLLAAKATGMFVDDIDEEIQYCRDVLEWLGSFDLQASE
jgi:hypothetical protein